MIDFGQTFGIIKGDLTEANTAAAIAELESVIKGSDFFTRTEAYILLNIAAIVEAAAEGKRQLVEKQQAKVLAQPDPPAAPAQRLPYDVPDWAVDVFAALEAAEKHLGPFKEQRVVGSQPRDV